MGEENSGFKVEGEEGPIFLLPFHRDCCFLILLRLGPVYDMCSEMFNRVAEAVVVVFLLALRIRISIVVDGEYLFERFCFLACLGDENEGFQKFT